MASSYLPLVFGVTDSSMPQSNGSNNLQPVAQNASHWDKCARVVFSETEFMPWDNPDNIISEETETVVFRIKNNLLVLLFLIGGPANVINMAVFYKQGLQDRVNLCLFALSLADGLFVTIMTLMHGEQLWRQFITKERMGSAFAFMANNNLKGFLSVSYISHALSAIIATERCLCVLNPLRFQTLLRTRTMAVIIVIISIVITCFCFIIAFRYRIGCYYDPTSGAVMTTFIEGKFYKEHKQFVNAVHSFILGLGLPATEMVVVTTATAITIVKLRQAVMWRSGTSSSISTKELAVTKTLVGNSVFFMACTIPASVIRFVNLFVPELSSGQRYHNLYLTGVWFTELFTFINATFNFFIYFIMGSHYRQTLWALFCRKGNKIKQ